MMIALATKNKLGFVDGNLPKPPESDPNCAAWKCCDAIIISYILRSLDSSIARSQSLTDLKQGSDTPITEFFTQIKAIWDQINQMNPLPSCTSAGCTCTQVFLKQQQEERFPGHTIDRCYKLHGYPPNFAKNKGKKVAVVVHMDDDANEQEEHVTHISSDQFNNILKALQSQELDVPTESQAHVAGTCLLTCSNEKWIVDSGATDHICSSLDLFDSYKVFDKVPNTITVVDGKHVLVEHIKTVMFDNGIVLQNGPTLSQFVVLGKLVSGMYAVDDKSVTTQVQEQSQEVAVADAGINNKLEDAKLWHLRMGHMPFNKEKVLEGLIVLTYTPAAEQHADIMTKALSSFQHNKLKSKLGMYSDVDTVPSLRGDVSDDTAECATSDDEYAEGF
uniref:Retrovirus-related Pol polyprotein from transposon TNT 1-94-like beta-barrel domain-containing protein n=1 Tax=Chenopodium quinoa TaxID=63459 RepID=A0A803N802_CHEQI